MNSYLFKTHFGFRSELEKLQMTNIVVHCVKDGLATPFRRRAALASCSPVSARAELDIIAQVTFTEIPKQLY